MTNLIENINNLKKEVPNDVSIVLATKYASIDDIGLISEAFPTLTFGENRVQHGEEKQAEYPNISNKWHFIGHLQRNKVKKVITNYSLIHSIDSVRLIEEIDIQAHKKNIISEILIQVNPLQEESKHGFSKNELEKIEETLLNFKNVKIKGLMCMAPFTENYKEIQKTFKESRRIYDNMLLKGFNFNYLSMGMSNDYKIAIDEGSNMIRVGSIVFR